MLEKRKKNISPFFQTALACTRILTYTVSYVDCTKPCNENYFHCERMSCQKTNAS